MSRPTATGRVARLQVAPEVPKVAAASHTLYDPAPLLQVQRLVLSERGVAGVASDGLQVLDVHHQDHPRLRFRGDNALSVGFTSHYILMRQIFGPHIVDGCAAENILIEADGRISLEDAPAALIIESADGEQHDLGAAIVAEPCLPFARWALDDSEAGPEQIRDALQQLRRGVRGFYIGTQHIREPFEVRVGDRLLFR